MDKAVPLSANMVVQIHAATKAITIYEGESADDGVYFPARSIFINERGLRVLRDVLIEMFPPEKEKEQPQKATA
jgi:hypothetical protein